MGKNNTQLLKIAESYLGQGGAVFRKYCGLPSWAAWCNAYVCYILNEGDDKNLFYDGRKVTYCPTSIKWCQKNLAQIPLYLALPMDIIYFDWEPNGKPNHIGFVRERKDCTEIYTIEGNTSKVNSKGQVIANGVVAERLRTAKYVQGVFRPHYKATYDVSKKLTIDGYFGYNSIACLQKALGLAVNGILSKDTVKALQKVAGVTRDGSWGVKTSKAVQKMVGAAVDGNFGPESVKALQKWINKKAFPASWVTKANAWARKTAKEKYHYVVWQSKVKETQTCPICTGRKYDDYFGGNCIWRAFSIWFHGGGIPCKCNCGVISDDVWEKIYKAKSDAEANKIATEHVGVPVTVIRNGGKTIPLSKLKAGMIVALFDGSKYIHTAYYQGDGKFSDASRGREDTIKADVTFGSKSLACIKVAIQYVGK